MKIKITRAKDSAWFATWRANKGTIDLGDFVVWIFGWEFAFFKKNNPFGRRIK